MNLINLRLRKYQHFKAELQKKWGAEISRVTHHFQDSLEHITAQLEPGGPKKVINLALDVMRPYFKPYLQSLGLRISRLTYQNIEVILPAKFLLEDSQENVDEGAAVTAALFAFRTLWKKNSPRRIFQVEILNFEFEHLRPLQAPLFLRFNLTSSQRESIYVELSDQSRSIHESTVQIYDQEDQAVAKVLIKAELKMEKVLPGASVGTKGNVR